MNQSWTLLNSVRTIAFSEACNLMLLTCWRCWVKERISQLYFKGIKHLGDIWHCQKAAWGCFVILTEFTPKFNFSEIGTLTRKVTWYRHSTMQNSFPSPTGLQSLVSPNQRCFFWIVFKKKTTINQHTPSFYLSKRTISYFIWPCFWWPSFLWCTHWWGWSSNIKLQEIRPRLRK